MFAHDAASIGVQILTGRPDGSTGHSVRPRWITFHRCHMGRIYDRSEFRRLPRDHCAVHELLGGNCVGPIHQHHVEPMSLGGDELGYTVPVCARHHPMLEALARRVYGTQEYRRCPHRHATAEGRRACERRLNEAVA